MKVETTGMGKLNERIEKLQGLMRDLRPLWEQLASDFYKDEKRIFSLKSPGQYVDLTPDYKKRKQKIHGFVYPILFATGLLARSLLQRGAYGSIADFKPREMTLGTSIYYAKYHHSKDPRRFRAGNTHKKGFARGASGKFELPRANFGLPRRPLWDEGDNGQSALYKRWIRISQAYVDKATKGAFNG